ncbi:Nucleic acid-binding, OB-fold [Sesbania bispinosa]|nr:Nucleic acid-binding, OB-fold [Sesbania bispinosa]
MMKKFKNVIVEGEVYTMMNFVVIRTMGTYHASKHDYELLFNGKTRVFPTQSELIPVIGLSLMTTKDVAKTNGESNYLIGEFVFT